MSVYIKGMEMPQGCEYCKLRHRHQGYTATDYCVLFARIVDPWTFGRFMNGARPDWCPLVPVPPHGRLIDAEALAEHTTTEWFCGRKRVNVPFKAVYSAPTIIPADKEVEG